VNDATEKGGEWNKDRADNLRNILLGAYYIAKEAVSSSPVSDPQELGGINLNEINVNRQGAGVGIQFDPVEIQEIIDMGITGFAPVIINLTPLPSILPLLGLAPQKEEDYLEVSSLN